MKSAPNITVPLNVHIFSVTVWRFHGRSSHPNPAHLSAECSLQD